MRTKVRVRSIKIASVTACVALLSVVALVSTAQAQGFSPEPSLNLPINETPLEPGDAARMYQALVPRSDLRYTKISMQVLGTKIAYVDEGLQQMDGTNGLTIPRRLRLPRRGHRGI